jgi:hypothetical protein
MAPLLLFTKIIYKNPWTVLTEVLLGAELRSKRSPAVVGGETSAAELRRRLDLRRNVGTSYSMFG